MISIFFSERIQDHPKIGRLRAMISAVAARKAAKLATHASTVKATATRQASPKATNEDVILVDGDDDEDCASVSSESSSSSEEDVEPRQSVLPERSVSRIQHAWSPSRPPPDSSEGEDRGRPVRSTPQMQDNGYMEVRKLSFVPIPQQNILFLSGEQPGVLYGRKGTVVTLKSGESLALQGVYSLTVLSGRVSICTSELSASPSTSHRVFAPKCLPTPIIQPVESGTYTIHPKLPPDIQRIARPDCTIIFLENLETGVEGLGKACKVFEGAFGTDYAKSCPLALNSAHLVCCLILAASSFTIK